MQPNGLVVLGNFLRLDGEYDCKVIRTTLDDRLVAFGLNSNECTFQVRDPAEDAKVRFKMPIGWHRDGMIGTPGWLVVWASRYPTLLRDTTTSRRVRFKAGDIVAFDNDRYEHRAPLQKGPRWFARVYVHDKDWVQRLTESVVFI